MRQSPGSAGSSVDWAAVRERLDRLAGEISGETQRTPDQLRQILEARARALSKPLATAPAGDSIEVLTFGISGERYALESRYVFASFKLEHLTLVPAAEPPLVGLTAWRGELLTLLDLRIVTGRSAGTLSDLSWVVVLGDGSVAFGVLVDQLQSIASLSVSEVKPVPEGLAEAREYVRGITNEATLVLDAAQLIRIHT